LRGIPQQMLRQFNEQRPYDLIILEYGLNVATERGRNYDNYQKGLLTSIEHLKNCFPQASLLLLSVGDRDYKTEDGELRTMPGVKNNQIIRTLLVKLTQHLLRNPPQR
jgi:hypothetical protein